MRSSIAVIYRKLRTLLYERYMTVAKPREVSGIAPNTMTKLRSDKSVMLQNDEFPRWYFLQNVLTEEKGGGHIEGESLSDFYGNRGQHRHMDQT